MGNGIQCNDCEPYFFQSILCDCNEAGQEVDLDVEQAKLPAYSLSRLEALYDTTEQAIEGNEKKLVALSETDIPSLKAALKELQSQIEFSKVVLSSEQLPVIS